MLTLPRRQIVYDLFADTGCGLEDIALGLSRDEMREAVNLFRDIRISPRITYDPDIERDAPVTDMRFSASRSRSGMTPATRKSRPVG